MPKTMLIDIQTFSSLYYHVQTLPEEGYLNSSSSPLVKVLKLLCLLIAVLG